MNKILLVEDDASLQSSLSRYLSSEGFDVAVASNHAQAERQVRDASLVILDWMLPGVQGIDILTGLRRDGFRTPVILLTAKADLIDKVVGLEAGANDYVTKPFEPRELLARIRAHLRVSQTKVDESAAVRQDRIVLEPASRDAYYEGQRLDLTKLEFDLLRTFVESPSRVFPREELLNRVWGYDRYPCTRTVDNHVTQLRQKSSPELFETVRGVGYRYRAPQK
jgi:DNA-binding response OmpR family regulator